ncbi:longitudinals lacking protein, isoforms H/M/V-like isoform X10 [Homarus americanus]|uniref:longitudinals lacking protein, isoforms H/M/V-like isoform X10 n=1 Tax=Homarus americanus TaxID=6706 RepID=UPI001C44DD16|nr:longitudinals lacking protein, isoforms H/M/V-like isoform X10 [Homarus americanus]
MEELLSLKWNNHRTTFIHILGVLRDKQAYTDVTLACDGKFYSVHKLVLSTCSDYFCAMFDKTACKSPVIVLKDIKCEDLEALLDYMYLGEVNVRQCDLASLIKAAENLRIKGLAVPDDEPPNKGTVAAPTSRSEPVRRDGGSGSPPTKRKRRDEGEDGREDVRPPPPSQGSLHTPPPPSRPKSPVSQRLSPSPHRTSQESPILEDRTSRPLSSPVEQPPPAPRASSQPPAQSSSSQPPVNQYTPDETPSFVKVEMEEEQPDDMHGDSYDLSTDGYKEEGDESGSGMNSDLPEFLQAAASGALASSTASYPHHSFAGPSGYQPGDLAGWQGDGASLGFPAHLNFTSDSSSQQNAPGVDIARQDLAYTTPQAVDRRRHEPGGHAPEGGIAGGLGIGLGGEKISLSFSRSCSVCGHSFSGITWKQKLERHLLVHTGEKPFHCPYCPHRTNRKDALKAHVAALHKIHLIT